MNQNVAYNEIVKSISFDQKEIMYNIMKLHNGGKAFHADMTYSSGKFYSTKKTDKYVVPLPVVKLDIIPQFDDVLKIEPLGKLPFDDASIDSIVIDLPFIIFPKDSASTKLINQNGRNIIMNRFSSYYPVSELLESYEHWLSEAYRVLKNDGICVFKCQSTITGGKQLMSCEYSWLCAMAIGFYTLDQFFLLAKNRLHSGKIKTQQHARKFTSTFYVFKKSRKNNISYLKWADSDKQTDFINSLKQNLCDNFLVNKKNGEKNSMS